MKSSSISSMPLGIRIVFRLAEVRAWTAAFSLMGTIFSETQAEARPQRAFSERPCAWRCALSLPNDRLVYQGNHPNELTFPWEWLEGTDWTAESRLGKTMRCSSLP
jgi:hypothetical protein